jgi:hypothetical protein
MSVTKTVRLELKHSPRPSIEAELGIDAEGDLQILVLFHGLPFESYWVRRESVVELVNQLGALWVDELKDMLPTLPPGAGGVA